MTLLVKDSQEQLYRGFSCPQEGIDEAYVELIGVRHARKVVRSFLNRFGNELDHHSTGLRELFERWLGQETNFETVWDMAFTQVRETLFNKTEIPQDLMKRAVMLALRLHECGASGGWRAQLETSTRLRWGRWLLPQADQIAIASGPDHAILHLTCGEQKSEVKFWMNNIDWIAEGAEALPRFYFNGKPVTLLLPNAPEALEFEDSRPEINDRTLQTILKNYAAAYEILQNYAPVYLPWVARVVRFIVPTETGPNEMVGGSNIHRLGAVHLSYDIPPVALADMLAHEATHQHMHLLSQAGALDNGLDENYYYSPMVKQDRQIRLIDLTYHAFANVVLFYRLCQENGLDDDGHSASHEQYLLPKLELYESYLRSSQGLTAMGRALWEPLAERLHA